MTSTLLRAAAWLVLLFIVFATLSPIGLRPISGLPVQLERFCAFAVLGFAFAVAYPRRLGAIALTVVAVAVGLELLQVIDPGRHGRVMEVLVKAAGGLSGVALARAANRLRHGSGGAGSTDASAPRCSHRL